MISSQSARWEITVFGGPDALPTYTADQFEKLISAEYIERYCADTRRRYAAARVVSRSLPAEVRAAMQGLSV